MHKPTNPLRMASGSIYQGQSGDTVGPRTMVDF